MSRKDDDLFNVLGSLETLLKTEKKKYISPKQKIKSSRSKSSKKAPVATTTKTMTTATQKTKKKQNIKVPRKLHNEKQNQTKQMTPKKYSAPTSSHENHIHPKKGYHIKDSIDSDPYFDGSLQISIREMNILCRYFLRWIRRCTAKINRDCENVNDNQSMSFEDRKRSSPAIQRLENKVTFSRSLQNRINSNINGSNDVKNKASLGNDLSDHDTDDIMDYAYQLNLDETSPLPQQPKRKFHSIVESELQNPNSSDFHYDSYEASAKSLSLLPPQGEGEVTEFNPSTFK